MTTQTLLPEKKKTYGELYLIMGSMFSSKTTELLRRMDTLRAVGYRCLYINHRQDTRSESGFSTHNALYKDTLEIDNVYSDQLSTIKIDEYDVIGIDEAQFFMDLKNVVLEWVEQKNKVIIVAGLDGNYLRQKFGQIIDLIPYADAYVKLQAYCHRCADRNERKYALFSYRKKMAHEEVRPEIVIGNDNEYSALCRSCYLEQSI